MREVFILGSKGIPARYGGFETFVEKLTEYRENEFIHYNVACINDNYLLPLHNGAKCFKIKVPNIGAAKAIYYDIKALDNFINYIKNNNIKEPIIYILACRIGPFIGFYKWRIRKLGIKLFVNPDGQEWKRKKWGYFTRKYWKLSEKLMVKQADLLICDSKNIENYIKAEYKKNNPKTMYIAYGAKVNFEKKCIDKDLNGWYEKMQIKSNEYYLVVGRFVPENNYNIIISEFMKSCTNKSLVMISDIKYNTFYKKLCRNTNFERDTRVKFVGTLYNDKLLRKIRINAYGYLHGHEVGGTNPSLLEALATTKLNILLDVSFNKEVAKDAGIYFNKEPGNLVSIINNLENVDKAYLENMSIKAKRIIEENYTWKQIVEKYETLFLEYSLETNSYDVVENNLRFRNIELKNTHF
ncbi:DUF1972 domain-containing protein [Clostridium sp. YIM B02555]|uniref:beta 1-4 rhamnosyltransferase Cps2T n=1 Tax=Clostridium sp. YIM B02555 TaxID=2911968 RepID=UPI001EEEC456|nr:DUF1972 domain-containing protein [Clostridium sp. YIM B02555]